MGTCSKVLGGIDAPGHPTATRSRATVESKRNCSCNHLERMVAVWWSAGLVTGSWQVRISAGPTSHQGLLSLPFFRVGKCILAAAGKAKIRMVHSACG